jgi:hypothetical protein
MADNGVQELEQAAPEIDKAPGGEQKAARSGADSVAAAAEAPAERSAENGGDSLLRSIYVARIAAPEAASVGDFSQMETSDASVLVRGAFLAHLSDGQSEAAGDHDRLGEDMLRAAYVKRLTAEPVPVKRAAPARKATAKKQPARAARSTRAKAKPARPGKARGKRRRR